jgi:hypothetical protein
MVGEFLDYGHIILINSEDDIDDLVAPRIYLTI